MILFTLRMMSSIRRTGVTQPPHHYHYHHYHRRRRLAHLISSFFRGKYSRKEPSCTGVETTPALCKNKHGRREKPSHVQRLNYAQRKTPTGSILVHYTSMLLFVEAKYPPPILPAPVLPRAVHAPRHRLLRVIFVSIYPNVLFSSLLLGLYCGRSFFARVLPLLLLRHFFGGKKKKVKRDEKKGIKKKKHVNQ